MTSRELYSLGLISGLTYTEMRRLEPGFISDMFRQRMKYDVQLAAPQAARKLFGG